MILYGQIKQLQQDNIKTDLLQKLVRLAII